MTNQIKGPMFEVTYSYLFSLKKNCFVFQSTLYEDAENGEQYVKDILVHDLTCDKPTPIEVPPCLSPKNLAGYLQGQMPQARIREIENIDQAKYESNIQLFYRLTANA